MSRIFCRRRAGQCASDEPAVEAWRGDFRRRPSFARAAAYSEHPRRPAAASAGGNRIRRGFRNPALAEPQGRNGRASARSGGSAGSKPRRAGPNPAKARADRGAATTTAASATAPACAVGRGGDAACSLAADRAFAAILAATTTASGASGSAHSGPNTAGARVSADFAAAEAGAEEQDPSTLADPQYGRRKPSA